MNNNLNVDNSKTNEHSTNLPEAIIKIYKHWDNTNIYLKRTIIIYTAISIGCFFVYN